MTITIVNANINGQKLSDPNEIPRGISSVDGAKIRINGIEWTMKGEKWVREPYSPQQVDTGGLPG